MRTIVDLAALFACLLASMESAGAADWTTRRSEQGFEVQIPAPANLSASDRGSVTVEAPDGTEYIVWPVFLTARNGRVDRVAALGHLARKLWGQVAWIHADPGSNGVPVLKGEIGSDSVIAAFAGMDSPQGTAGYLYGVRAPGPFSQERLDTAARIFSSFQIRGTSAPKSKPGGTSPMQVRWVSWTDPNEGSFSTEVPASWNASGGLVRRSATEPIHTLQVSSPDNRISIAIGDGEIPTFVVPNQQTAFAGLREGMWYSPGYGVQMLLRRYVPGPQFAAEYAMQTVSQACSGLQLNSQKERPDVTEAVNRLNAQYGLPIQFHAGEVSFTCSLNRQLARGYYFAGTQLTSMMGSGLWQVPMLYGFVSTSDRFDEASQIFQHVIGHTQINPQWYARQQQTTAAVSGIVTETSREINQMIMESYEYQQEVQDELSRRRSNVILGIEDVVDTRTGEQFKVESGSDYYWVDNLGNIVGTDTDTRPGIDFVEMLRLP